MIKTRPYKLLLLMLISTKLMGQGDKVDSSEMRILRIDPSNAKGASISQVFEEVKFIPLETTKESLFGTISQLKVTTDRYVIWDNDTKSILIFNKNGKYQAKINGSKIDKDPASMGQQSFNGFNLVNENNEQVIQVTAGKYNYFFDLNARLIRKVKGERYFSKDRFDDGTIVDLGYLEKKGTDSTYFELSLVKEKKRVQSFFPYSMLKYKTDLFFTAGEPITNYGKDNEFFFIRPYEYSIYKVTPKQLNLAYSLYFPQENSLPIDFLSNPAYKGKRREFFEKNPKIFYGIGSAYEIGNNLFFKVVSWSWGRDERKAFIYNLKKNVITSITDLEPDSLSQFLPVTDAGLGGDFVNRGILRFDGTHFYTSYSSLVLFTVKEQNDGKNRIYEPILNEYFKTQSKKSNPVIIQLRPRKT